MLIMEDTGLTLEIGKMEDTRNTPHIPVEFYSYEINLSLGDSWPQWVIGELPCRGDVIHSNLGIKGVVARRHFFPTGRIRISLNPEL